MIYMTVICKCCFRNESAELNRKPRTSTVIFCYAQSLYRPIYKSVSFFMERKQNKIEKEKEKSPEKKSRGRKKKI